MRGANGHAELVDTIREIALGTQPRIEPASYGTLDAGGNLSVYGFPQIFDHGEYGFLLRDSLPDPMTITTATHVGDHGTHTHDVVRPAELRPILLLPGTVVGVVWTHNRSRPLVVGILG